MAEWLMQNPSHREYFKRYSDSWVLSGTIFAAKKFNKEESFSRLKEHIRAERKVFKLERTRKIIRQLWVAAAGLLLIAAGFVASLLVSSNNRPDMVSDNLTEIICPLGFKTRVLLADGSDVWLNAGSRLKYKGELSTNERLVELKGEGYFEIFSDSKKPFIVKTGEIQIRATGTTFNVMAYPEDDKIGVSLINGSVQVERQKMNGETVMLYKMKPTDLTVFDKRIKGISTRTILDDRYFAWKEGKLVFCNEPISEVVKKLNRWFNCNIQIIDPELNNLKYTATFVDESLLQVLELLTMVSPVSYSIQEREEIAPGSFSKMKIFLTYRRR